MSMVLPDTPFMDSLILKHGSDYFFATYFDESMNVRDDAPEELKRECAMLDECV